MEIATIYTTLPNRTLASEMAKTLVSEKIVACANLIPGVTSFYTWENRLAESDEIILLLKTRSSLIQEVTNRVRSLHPYECPCVIAWTAQQGNDEFFRWVESQTESGFVSTK